MIGRGPSASGMNTRIRTAPASVSRVLPSTPAISTGVPVMDGDHRARNEALTSSIGRRHCGAVVLASFSSISSLSAGCRVIVRGSSRNNRQAASRDRCRTAGSGLLPHPWFEDLLAQADVLRRDFDEFVLADVF